MKALIISLQFLLCLPFIVAKPAAPSTTPAAPAGNHTPSTSHAKSGKESTPQAGNDILPPPVAKGGIAPTREGNAKDPLPAEYKGAVTVDLSHGLSALLQNAGGDMSQFRKSQEQKSAAMAKAGNNLESVSGGFWDDINGTDETFQTSKTDEKGQTGKTAQISKTSQTDNTSKTSQTDETSKTSKTSKTARDISHGDITDGNMTIAQRAVPSRFTECLGSSKLDYYAKGEKGYADYADAYNLRIPKQADVVVVADDTIEVQLAVICAAKHKVPAQAKGGGHSYASFSSAGGADGGLVIDLREMNRLSYNSRTGIAIADGGMRLGNLALGLLSLGRAMPHGDCPSVGLAGHSLHGGFGYTSRMWGLSTDAIVGLDVVTSDGRRQYASARENADLFWAMRGAGDSFGIATRFYLQTEPRPQMVVHFTYNLNELYGNERLMAKAFVDAQSCLISRSSGIDRRVGLTVRLASNNYRIAGYFYGRYSSWKTTVQGCLGQKLQVDPTVEILSFAQALETIAGQTPLLQTATNRVKSNFFAKSVLIPETYPLSKTEMQTYFSTLVKGGAKVKDQWVVTFRLMGGVDSQVPAQGDSFSAVSDRDSLWIVQHDGQTGRNPRDVTRFINQITDTLISATNGEKFGAFAPFVDPTLSNTAAHSKYFSKKTYSKLRDLKTIWDKDEVFKNPHSVWPRRSR